MWGSSKASGSSLNKKLTPQQETFAIVWARTGNATKAAKEAGYSPKRAGRTAVDLSKNKHVLARVEQEREIINRELRAAFQPLALKAFQRANDILDHADVKNMSLVQTIGQVWEYAGLKPASKQEISGPEGQPLQIGVVAIPAKVQSVDEWVRLQEERKALSNRNVVDAEGE